MSKIKSFIFSLLLFTFTYVFVPSVALLTPQKAVAAECTLYETIHPNFPLTGAHLSTGKCSTCASCHAGGIFLGTSKICATCHNGSPTSSTVGRSANHIPIGTVNCDSCHNTTSFTASWSMNHTAVASQRCDSCHNGNFTNYGARGKPRDHIPTTADCGTCHKNTGRNWDAGFTDIHAGVTTGCVACHNGVNAKGKSNAPAPGHPATSDQCETCHSVSKTISFKCY